MAGALVGAAFHSMHVNQQTPAAQADANLRRVGGSSTEPTDSNTHMAGAIACIFGNLLISLSFNLQRLAHKNNTEGLPYTRLRGWWAGLICMFIGENEKKIA